MLLVVADQARLARCLEEAGIEQALEDEMASCADLKPSALIGIAALEVYFRFIVFSEEMRGRHANGFEIRCGRAGRG